MTVIQEAHELITKARRSSYGPARESFERVAAGWSLILKRAVTAEEVALMMIWFKISRELGKHQRDNVVDIIGYAGLLGELTDDDSDK